MSRRLTGRMLRFGAMLGVALLVGACGLFGDDKKPPCPQAFILSEASNVTVFNAGTGRDLTDVVLDAQVGDLSVTCTFTKENKAVNALVNVAIAGLRGPAMQGQTAEVPFFVAVTDRQKNVINKVQFNARLDFGEGRRRAAVLEETESTITIEPGKTTRDYVVLIGIQLTEEQLAYNRSLGMR